MAKSIGSSNKVSFGKRKTGRAKKVIINIHQSQKTTKVKVDK